MPEGSSHRPARPAFLSAVRRRIGPLRNLRAAFAIPRYGAPARYRPPPPMYGRLQWIGHLLTRFGASPRYVVTLEVPGRRSGALRRTNLVLLEHDSERYLVALAGESEWVRNVRAASGRVTLARGRRRWPATLKELPVADRDTILQLHAVAPRYPVFQVRDGWEPEPQGHAGADPGNA